MDWTAYCDICTVNESSTHKFDDPLPVYSIHSKGLNWHLWLSAKGSLQHSEIMMDTTQKSLTTRIYGR